MQNLSMSMFANKADYDEAFAKQQAEAKKGTYKAYKLGRRTDAFHKGPAAVSDGLIFQSRATAKVYDFKKEDPIEENEGNFIPKIGKCVWIKGCGMHDYVRTSIIEDFYIHSDYDNSKDKIVLKAENAHLLDTIKFDEGDVLLVTMNSLYFLKA